MTLSRQDFKKIFMKKACKKRHQDTYLVNPNVEIIFFQKVVMGNF